MNPDENQIEEILRHAPQPPPPHQLKGKLIMQAQSAFSSPRSSVAIGIQRSWIRRWWPVLIPAGFCLVCAAVVTQQTLEIRELKQALQSLPAKPSTPEVSPAVPVSQDDGASVTDAQELERLKATASQLSAEIARLQALRAENQKLQAQLAAPPAGMFTPEEVNAMEQARARAMQIQCVNNLKQMGLAARIWAGDNNETNPPDILSMTNELSTPKILVCGADAGRKAAESFATYNPSSNCSYEYLAPSSPETEPTRVLFRCPIHGTVCLVDGSVQMVNTNNPNLFVERDGKLYYEPSSRH